MKESLFVSMIRSFLNALFAMIGVLIGLVALILLIVAFSSSSQSSEQPIMEYLADADGNDKVLADSAPVILRVDITGVIGDLTMRGEDVESFLRASRHGSLKNNRVKGVLLYINSPGGTVIDSDIIYRALLRYKELYKVPIYAYARGLCASGGFYIACAAEKINCSPVTIVGSVGTIYGPSFNYFELMQKIGLNALVLSDGKYKEKYPPFSKLHEGNDKTASYDDLIRITKQSYGQFLDIVTKARASHGLTHNLLVDQYGAQVYIGSTAQEYGFVDNGDTSYEETLKELTTALGIKPTTSYQVVRFNTKKSALKELVMSRFNLFHTLFGVPSFKPGEGELLYYYAH